MIIGDAGYGLIFLLAAVVLKIHFKSIEKLKLPLNLFIILSFFTIIWGALGGSWFSIPSEKLPPFMQGIEPLTNPEKKDKNIQMICFLLAACHLSFARIWKALILRSIKSLGQIGWAMLLWANYFVVSGFFVYDGKFPGFTIWLYLASIIIIGVFYVNWRNIGDVFNFPFSIIGAFSDILSYIRLYAVGLASYFLAFNVNDIASNMFGSLWTLPIGILLIILGHSLNIALSFLGVLVHGVRLNALEFSNQMELQWRGRRYKPLEK
jgi:V/A-type H+-transporting ATPase subunit I